MSDNIKKAWDAGKEYSDQHHVIFIGTCGNCGGKVFKGGEGSSEVHRLGVCLKCGWIVGEDNPPLKMRPSPWEL